MPPHTSYPMLCRKAARERPSPLPLSLPSLHLDDSATSLPPLSSGVTDRVVNQLLTELDGVEGLRGVGLLSGNDPGWFCALCMSDVYLTPTPHPLRRCAC